MPEMKTCSKCERDLPADKNHFSTQSAKKDGLCPMCKECRGRNFTHPKPIAKEGFKICSGCGDELLATNEYFGPRKDSKDGLKGICRICTSEYDQEYFKENKESIMTKNAIYRSGHIKEKSIQQKKFYQENKIIIITRCREYRENNKPAVYAVQRLYRLSHKETASEYNRMYRAENKEYMAEYGRRYYINNKEYVNARNKLWRSENRELCNLLSMRYEAKKKKLAHTLTVEQWVAAKQHFDNKCCFCGKEVPLTKEHLVPVHNGGEMTSQNIIGSCKSCNSSKRASEWKTWFRRQPTYALAKEQKILFYLGYKDNRQQLALF